MGERPTFQLLPGPGARSRANGSTCSRLGLTPFFMRSCITTPVILLSPEPNTEMT